MEEEKADKGRDDSINVDKAEARRHARQLDWLWIDTCCIDKQNSVELGEAINSMYEWYREANECYVYLFDASSADDFVYSTWFSRGWTL